MLRQQMKGRLLEGGNEYPAYHWREECGYVQQDIPVPRLILEHIQLRVYPMSWVKSTIWFLRPTSSAIVPLSKVAETSM